MGCNAEKEIRAIISKAPKTFCDPLDLNYRFMTIEDGAGICEAADPVMVFYKDNYWPFASKSFGYWYSSDFSYWICRNPQYCFTNVTYYFSIDAYNENGIIKGTEVIKVEK